MVTEDRTIVELPMMLINNPLLIKYLWWR